MARVVGFIASNDADTGQADWAEWVCSLTGDGLDGRICFLNCRGHVLPRPI